MLKLFGAEITLPEGIHLNQSFGSVFQGALIEQINQEWAGKLHEQAVRPYSQYLCRKEGKSFWHIATLNEEACDQIVQPLTDKKTLYLKQKGYEVGLGDFHVIKESSFQTIEEHFWTGTDRIHHIDMDFLTTTSFKSNGAYIIFPETVLLFNNILRKWNTYTDSMTLGESHLENKLSEGMNITGYHLQTRSFSVEGRYISGFFGNIRLGRFKNDVVSRIAGMLSVFAEYSGAGMKTALGMGAVQSEIFYYQKQE